MFWLPAVVNALKSNSDQTNANNLGNIQNSMSESDRILQKRDQRKQISDNVGANNSNIDIDSIVSSLFPNKKKSNTGGFGNYGFLQ